ncbi:MAG: hypothetical protein HKN44_05875 [Ilumatobacter sp.]|nr:hypothetical protein [Ilumatobacter sp.]
MSPRRPHAALVGLALVIAACAGSDTAAPAPTPPIATDPPPATPAPPVIATDPPSTSPPPTEQVDTTSVPDTRRRGGTLRYGLEADVDGLNPVSSALSAPGQLMANAVFDTLTAFDVDGNVVPYLASSVQPVDGDLTRWRVTLREGITFHDGTPLNAAAVQTNFELALGSAFIGIAMRPFYPAENATEVVDEYTLDYQLLDPSAVFPATLSTQTGYVASPAWLAAALDDPALNQKPVGTGPFVFDRRSQDAVTRFVRNDDWWRGDVHLDAVEFIPVPDPDTRNDLLIRGELDALQTTNPASVGDLRERDGIQNFVDDSGEETFVMLNTEHPPFDDIRARQALTFATPLRNFRELIGLGIAPDADQMFTADSPYHNPAVVQEGDRPDEAIALAAAYCADVPAECTNGRIDTEYQWFGPSVIDNRIAEILDEGWSRAFNVTFDELAQDTHIQQTALGQYDATLWRQFGSDEPSIDRFSFLCRTIDVISLNFARYCTPERDALLLEVQTLADPAARIPLWHAITQDIHDAHTYIFLTHTIWDNAFGPQVRGVCDRVSPDGVALQCVGNGRTWFDSLWLSE